ncbi:hypothetical protein [Curtobacterium sp. JUb34]|uniref:hypothetical protein n=1 Tax=Curtobacterium sp. JUb34 TaxID=2485109 RepID=UPI0011CE3079|nr:hypothetical protein [Curtobacterium sp. JUb34]
MTAEQLLAVYGRTDAPAVLAAMQRTGELDEVLPGVWVHVVVHATGWDIDLAARAAWIALEPALPLWDRARRDRSNAEQRAVIGGGAAYQRWGFGFTPWPALVHLSDEATAPPSDADVQFTSNDLIAEEVSWFGPFPYVSVEAVLAGQFGYTVDFDEVALDTADAIHRFGSLQLDALLRHLQITATHNDWDGPLSAEAVFAELLTRVSGWHTQPDPTPSTRWVRNRAAAEAMNERMRRRRDFPASKALWDGIIEGFRGPRPDPNMHQG